MAIDISIVGDASQAIRAAERTGTALSDVVDELDRLDDAGKDAGSGLEDGLKDAERAADKFGDTAGDSFDKLDDASKDAGKSISKNTDDGFTDAGKSTDRFEDKMKSAFTEAERQAADAGRKIGTSTDEGFSKAGAATEDFRDEAKQNLGETMSSFRGDVEDIPQLVQDVFGGVASSMGGVGLALTAGVAAGIGIAVAKAQELAEENTAAQESVAGLAGEFIEFGNTVDQLRISDRIKEWGLEVNEDNWITFWIDEAETNFQKYGDLAEEAGVRTSDSIRGMKGSYDDAVKFLKATTDTREELTKAIEEGTRYDSDGVEIMDASAIAASKKRDALDELRGEVQTNADAHREAAEIEEIYSESVKGSREEIEAKNEALNETADIIGDAITSELDYQQALDDTAETLKDNGKTLDTSTEKGRENWEALIGQAEASRGFRDAQMEAGVPAEALNGLMADQRERFLKSADAAGMNKDEAKALADQLGLVPTDISTEFSETGADMVKSEGRQIKDYDGTPVGFRFTVDSREVRDEISRLSRTTVDIGTKFGGAAAGMLRGWL